MSISYSKIKKIAFFCLAFPSVFFALGFLRWYIAFPVAALIAIAYFFAVRTPRQEQLSLSAEDNEPCVQISRGCFISLCAIVILWCYFGGLGNLYYQSDDWSARNAIFRDLISHDWPVIYESKDVALVYYISFWLPSALIGKLVLFMFGNLEAAFFVGNLFLWLWSAICILTAILCTLIFLKVKSSRQIFFVVAVFICFSGLDLIGILYYHVVDNMEIGNHIEWWSNYYQYSSMTTALFWVFNQSIIAWVAVACFLNEKTTRNYAFIVVMCASSGPLPCVGLGIYMVGMAACRFYRAFCEKHIKDFWKEIFTPQNIIAAVAVFPIYLLYYMTNLAVNVGQDHVKSSRPLDRTLIIILALATLGAAIMLFLAIYKKRPFGEWVSVATIFAIFLVHACTDPDMCLRYAFFLLLECGLYLLLLWRSEKRNPLFHLTFFLFMLCPVVRIGTAADFCMRASIPGVFVLMVLCMRYLLKNSATLFAKSKGFRQGFATKSIAVLLLLCITIGGFTAYKEFERGVEAVITNKNIALVCDTTYTFDQVFDGELKNLDRNFIAENYKETFFFRYLAK